MKKLLFVSVLTTISIIGFAQEAIPEFRDKVMVLTKNNTLESLENTSLMYVTKSGMSKASVFLRADGAHSANSFDPMAGSRFIVKIEPGIDPETRVVLYYFTVEKKYRKITTAAVGMAGVKNTEMPIVKINYKKIQDGVYVMTPVTPLETGEYFFSAKPITGTQTYDVKGFAFSVPEK